MYHRLIGQLPHGRGLPFTHDQVITWTKARVRVYSDSGTCLGKMSEHSEANQRWKHQVDEFRQSNSNRELIRIVGEQIEFEWNIPQDLLHWRSSRRPRAKTIRSELEWMSKQWRTYFAQLSSSSSSSQKNWWLREHERPGLNSQFLCFPCSSSHFACRKLNLGNRRGV